MVVELEEQYDRIYHYCYYKIHQVHLAEDITQETFLRYFERNGTRVDRPLAYLYTIARNLCIDELRRKKMGELSENMTEYIMSGGSDMQDRVTDHIVLRQALKTLTEEERELVVLRYVNDVPIADLAEIYEISRFAVYRKIKKVLGLLKKRMIIE